MKQEELLTKIVKILVEKLDPVKIVLIGSRAKGRAKPYSDFDVVVILSEEIRRSIWLRVKEHLDESIFPYSVDLLLWNKLDPEFQKIILETGRCLYEKK